MRTRFLIAALAAALFPAVAPAQSTRLLHQPDVSAQYVAFAYAGDIWLAPRSGGDARRVTSSPTVESDPHFSPDGKWLAFTGEYGGNPDVYVVSVEGGTPRRLTYHPGADLVRGWTPDGQDVVFESQRTGMPDGEPQLWTVPLTGGLPTRLPVPRALYGAVSPDGSDLAYQLDRPWEVEMQHYRGGQNQPIRVMDLKTYAMYKLPWTDSRDQQPVWLGNTIYFISDRDWINNLWSYDTKTKALKQITHYRDYRSRERERRRGRGCLRAGGRRPRLRSEDGPGPHARHPRHRRLPLGHAARGRHLQGAHGTAALAHRRARPVRSARRRDHGAHGQGHVA